MISPELIRRYPFFSGLSYEQLVTLAKVGDELSVDTDHYFYEECEKLNKFFLVVEGAVAIVIEVPDRDAKQPVSGQLFGEIKTKDVTTSTVGTGDVFGWPALVPPHEATTGAKALMPSRVVAFDSQKLLKIFDEDCRFGYIMTQKAAQVMRERLRDLRIETLASFTEKPGDE